MKVFWLDGGLHAEPETPEEGQALHVIFESAKRDPINPECPMVPKTAIGSRLTSSVDQ
jgi:hypothetical protein